MNSQPYVPSIKGSVPKKLSLLFNILLNTFTHNRCLYLYILYFVDKVPPEVTLFGSQYFTYDLTSKGSGIDSSNDELNMYFRTTQPNGLLFYTGEL